jgi:hypothetical protein
MRDDDHGRNEQVHGSVGSHDLFFCGIHVAKENPKFQVITIHYCDGRAAHVRTADEHVRIGRRQVTVLTRPLLSGTV